MLENVKSYKNTSVNYMQSQAKIGQLLEDRGIKETRFTNISNKTAKLAGLEMEKESTAIMLEFFQPKQLADGLKGTIPIRIIIPNIPDDEKKRNQAYRIFYWYLKTKFEAVDTGLVEFEQEFMPHIALGKGSFTQNVWNVFKKKMLPSIMSGKSADVNLLTEGDKNNPKKEE